MVIKQFNFGTKSQGTPSWVNGFVIPKGKLAKKHAAIVAFLQFVHSNDAYLAFAESAQYYAPSYLLPTTYDAYNKDSDIIKKQPLLPKFHEAMSVHVCYCVSTFKRCSTALLLISLCLPKTVL